MTTHDTGPLPLKRPRGPYRPLCCPICRMPVLATEPTRLMLVRLTDGRGAHRVGHRACGPRPEIGVRARRRRRLRLVRDVVLVLLVTTSLAGIPLLAFYLDGGWMK